MLDQFFKTMNWSQHSGEHDINIFIIAKENATDKELGVIQFLITPEFTTNNCKAALYSVIPSAQNRGLEKLLMSSIFKILPSITRIFLHTRSTNEQALTLYKEWGFSRFEGKLPQWTDVEYITTKSDTLQKLSESFIAQP